MKVPYFREKIFGCLERGQTKNQICRPTIKDILWRKGYCCIIIEHNKDDSLLCLDASEYQFTIIQETYIYILNNEIHRWGYNHLYQNLYVQIFFLQKQNNL